MRLRIIALALGAALAGGVHAQTEEHILKFAKEGMESVQAGSMSHLTYYRELYRQISITPVDRYPWKAENLRAVSYRIDVYEALEAGKITADKAARLIVEHQAEWEQAGRAAREREVAGQAADQQRRQAVAAQDQAERRALAMQILLNQPQPTHQPVQPYIPPPAVNCTTTRAGNQAHTRCQ